MLYIRPKVGMYGSFARLNYKPWYALAEFVDNAIQSFVSNEERLRAKDGNPARLTIRITVEDDRIVVADDAAGIRSSDFPRAFLPAEPPPDRTGLSEFGIGMKAAACWFARRWSVRTSALGETVERTVHFDVPRIVAEGIEELEVEEKVASASDHFTTLTLEQLNHPPRGRTVSKIKSHLAGIYRRFIGEGRVRILYNNEELSYAQPQVLSATWHRVAHGPRVRWHKTFECDLGDGHRVWGWAALRSRASVAEAGFALFRRERLISGGLDATYRPHAIFRNPNSYTYQRLFGEISVEGFQVSHTKDGLQWDEWEDDILEWLRKELDKEPLPLLDQAENFRVRATGGDVPDTWGSGAVAGTARTLEQHAGPVISQQLADPPAPAAPQPELSPAPVHANSEVELSIEHDNQQWRVVVELARDPAQEDWYTYAVETQDRSSMRLRIRLNLAHPFSEQFALKDESEIEPLLRLAAGLAISEIVAYQSGVINASAVRRNLNALLRRALWQQ